MYLSVIAFAFFIGCLVYRGWHKDKPINPADGLYAPYKPHMSLIERWRDEERRMADAEDPFCNDAEDEIEPDDPAITFCDEDEPEDDDSDPAFCGLDREKEVKRLERVLEGMYTRRDRMLYTYGCMDRGASDEDWAKLEKTKAWRGLQFDIKYTEKRIEMLKGE